MKNILKIFFSTLKKSLYSLVSFKNLYTNER